MSHEIWEAKIDDESVGQRLDKYLTAALTDASRTKVQRWIKEERVQVNGAHEKASYPLELGDAIRVAIEEEVATLELVPEDIPVNIVYEDDAFLVVDKPAGMVVHPAPGHPSGTLVNGLLHYGIPLSSMGGEFKPGLVHRLDKDTSGLIVVAKNDVVHRKIAQQFQDRTVKRIYFAFVQDVVQQDEGIIDAPIARDPNNRQRMHVEPGSMRDAITRYKVLQRFDQATWLELFLETGRTHQIRVHLRFMGHLLLGDLIYGTSGGFTRQALHAHKLGFVHPETGEEMLFESPMPAVLQEEVEKNLGPLESSRTT